MARLTLAEIRRVAPRKLLLGAKPEVRGLTSDISRLKLAGRNYEAVVTQAITEAALDRSIELSSIVRLTARDPHGELRRSKLIEKGYEVELDGLYFWLSQIERAEDKALTLIHEDRRIAKLRRVFGPEKALREKFTRAEFIAYLVLKALPGQALWIPELHDVQPIEQTATGGRQTLGEGVAGVGGRGAAEVDGLPPALQKYNRLYTKHVSPDYGGEQMPLDAIAALAEWAGQIQGTDVPGVTMSQVTIGEANKRPGAVGNDAAAGYGNTFGFGLYQITTGQGDAADAEVEKYGGYEAMLNPVLCSLVMAGPVFFGSRGLQPWVGTSAVTDTNAHYSGPLLDGAGEATGAARSSTSGRVVEQPYPFEVKGSESFWKGIQRLATEINWRAFFSGDLFYYISEPELLNSKELMQVSEDAPGIDTISWSIKPNRTLDELTASGRSRTWAAAPGTVAKVSDEGPADGRYIVSAINSPLVAGFRRGRRRSTDDMDATLKRPTKPLPEPAPETRTKGSSISVGDSSTGVGDTLTGGTLGQITLGNEWGGTLSIFEQFVHSFMARYGLEPGSQKRSPAENDAVGGAANSDHLTTNTNSYATDYGTTDGYEAAQSLARAMGFSSWSDNSYTEFTITVAGVRFSVQILWGAEIDHDDHVHVGITRIG